MSEVQRKAFYSNMETMKKRVILSTKRALAYICNEKAIEYLQCISDE